MEFHKKESGKYFFWAAVVLLIVLSYLILKSYFVALVSAFVLAYLVRPMQIKLKKIFGVSASAFISIAITLLIIVLPILLVVLEIARQAYSLLSTDGGFGELFSSISLSPPFEGTSAVSNIFNELSSAFFSYLTSFVLSVPHFAVSLFILLVGMYYILVDWEKFSNKLKICIPFQNKEKVSEDIAKVTNILVYGTLLMAFIEFVVSVFGFYLLGIKFSLLLAAMVFFSAFIPFVGPAAIWAPTLLYYLLNGNYFVAGGVLVIGLILSVVVDTLLRAKILGDRSKINPLIMILGLLGGVSVFGAFGFIIGPLVLAYTLEILEEIAAKH
ncbi:AI-2E family transporter [Candidatus Pacearchaeota archaeon]|nr:AI-2E family transporter [Candidatus Pacearchaeota archaeon]